MFRQSVPCQLTVMVMVSNDQNQVLTLQRTKSWQGVTFPGGHLDEGESVLDCARREVFEETGIQIRQKNFGPADSSTGGIGTAANATWSGACAPRLMPVP